MAKEPSSRPGCFPLLMSLLRYWWVAALAAALVAVVILVKSWQENPPVQLQVVHNTRIDITPEEIRSIRDIGQWEFLSVRTEEMVEWHRRRTLGNDHLVRIYQGTLRLGVDLAQADSTWFTSLPDSVAQLQLPRITLLDERFIDETRTRSFYQKGSVPPEVLDQLYRQASLAMKRRCLTKQNIQAAERNAREQFTRIFTSFGFKKVEIEFVAPKK